MTISAFFMNKTFFYLNILIRLLIIAAGLVIEFNAMNLPEVQHQSIVWIGRVMIGFGLLRLAWLMYQVHVQSKDEEVKE
jgi:hypothetical protein